LKIKKKESRLDSSGNSKPRRKTAIKSAKKIKALSKTLRKSRKKYFPPPKEPEKPVDKTIINLIDDDEDDSSSSSASAEVSTNVSQTPKSSESYSSVITIPDDDDDENITLEWVSIYLKQHGIAEALFYDFICNKSKLMQTARKNEELNGVENLRQMGRRALQKVQKYEDLVDERAKAASSPIPVPSESESTSENSAKNTDSSSELENTGIDVPQVIRDQSSPEVQSEQSTQAIPSLPPNDCGEIANLQFPKKIWYIVNNPYYHCMFWTGINCDPNEKAEIGHGDYRGSTSFVINKKWVNQPGQVLDVNNNTLFTTSNYQSLIRQLNLYGFRKVKRYQHEETYANYRRNICKIIDPLSSKPSAKEDVDEFRHTFFRENMEHKTKFIKRQKPFKPTTKQANPPIFRKGFGRPSDHGNRTSSRGQVPVLSDNPALESDCDSDTFSDDYNFHDDEVIDLARMAMSGESVFNPLGDGNFDDADYGDDPEAAFGPRGAAS